MNRSALAAGVLCSLLALLAVPAVSAGALDPAPPPASPDIVVLIDPLQDNAEPFRQVIADAAQYKLGQAGLAAEIAPAAAASVDKPLPEAAAVGAAIALVCKYEVQGQEMAVSLGWYDTQVNRATASAEAKGEVNLHLDGVIFSALDDILDKVQDRVRALAKKNAERAAAQLPPAAKEKPPVLQPAQPAQPAAPPAPAQGRATARVLLSGGFAPFLPTGAAGYYFNLGYLPSVLASFFLQTPVGPVGIGAYLGMDYFAAVGLTDTSNNYLIPLGLDVRYELDAGMFRPFFHVTGGPALLVMVTGSQGTIIDVMPFLKSGIGLEVRVTSWLGISAMADYDIYFEMPYLLMGFSPSLNMAVRL